MASAADYQPSEEEIAIQVDLGLTRDQAIAALRQNNADQYCPVCGKSMQALKDKNRHIKRCRAKKDGKPSTVKGQRPSSALQQVAAVSGNLEPQDITLTAEQIISKGRVVRKFESIQQALARSPLSPNTATASLDDLMQMPVRRNIVTQVARQKDNVFRLEVSEVGHDDLETGFKPQWDCYLSGIPSTSLSDLVTTGLVPILQRLFVSPAELPRECQWLINAAIILASKVATDFSLEYPEPQLLYLNNFPLARVQIHGFDPVETPEKRKWEFSCDIAIDTVPGDEPIQVPNADRIVWLTTTTDDVDDSFRQSPEWNLARLITVNLYGFIGKEADASVRCNALIARYATRESYGHQILDRISKEGPDFIRNVTPWRFRPARRQRRIRPRAAILSMTTVKIPTIQLPRNTDLNCVLEILTGMLTKLLTGSDVLSTFRQGSASATRIATELAEGLDCLPQPQCLDDDRYRHWHVCAACLYGYPCSFFRNRRQQPLICHFCVSEGKEAGWAFEGGLDEQAVQDEAEWAPLAEKSRKYQKGTGKADGDRGIRDRLPVWIKDENKKGKFGWGKERLKQEFAAILKPLIDNQQADSPSKWWDLYVDQLLDEDVEKLVDWEGKKRSPFTPSVEAIHMIFFVAAISRYHVNGNCAVVSKSMNMMLGPSPKSVAKATHQYLLASSPEHYAHAMILAQRCMILRWELETNAKIERIGMSPTPYLEELEQCWKTATLPSKRYISRKLLSSNVPGQHAIKTSRPSWTPPNYTDYLVPQIEKVAQRYDLDHTDRDLWTLVGPITANTEVPFVFSKDSVVESWTWYEAYSWFCYRASKLKEQCDNHSTEAYKDNPESRDRLNIERFITGLLHIHLWKLAKNRDEPKQWPSQRLRALDAFGLESVSNMRHPWVQSVAHNVHGAVMLLGYIDLADEFPTSQGPDVYDHDVRNVDLETWTTNVGRFTEPAEYHAQIVDQFRKLRVQETDFLPNAPRPYPPGLFIGDSAQHQLDLNPTISAPDADFDFIYSYNVEAQKRTEKKRVGVRDRRKVKTPKKFEADDHDTEMILASEEENDPDFSDLPSGLRAGSDLEYESGSDAEVQLGDEDTPFHISSSPPLSPILRTGIQRANLARGKATCYVSSALQILSNIHPLVVLVKSAKPSTVLDKDILIKDVDFQKHKTLLMSLVHILTQLDLYGPFLEQVPVQETKKLITACESLNAVFKYVNFEWRDTEQDSVDFLVFLLERLNVITDASGVSDRNDAPLRYLQDVRASDFVQGKSLPRIEDDVDEWRVAFLRSGNDSEISNTYSLHVVEEVKCDNAQCGHVKRTFNFESTLRFKVPFNEDQSDLTLPDLANSYFQDTYSGRCPCCSKGFLRDVRRRVMNEPEIIMVSFTRGPDWDPIKQRVSPNLRRVKCPHSVDLADWNPAVFSDPSNYTPQSLKYNLVGAMFYLDNPPHYLTFVKLGAATEKPGSKGESRYGRKNDGAWVRFDDREATPGIQWPQYFEQEGYCEYLFVFRKNDPDEQDVWDLMFGSDDVEPPNEPELPALPDEDDGLVIEEEVEMELSEPPDEPDLHALPAGGDGLIIEEDVEMDLSSGQVPHPTTPALVPALALPPRSLTPAPLPPAPVFSPIRLRIPLLAQLYKLPHDHPLRQLYEYPPGHTQHRAVWEASPLLDRVPIAAQRQALNPEHPVNKAFDNIDERVHNQIRALLEAKAEVRPVEEAPTESFEAKEHRFQLLEQQLADRANAIHAREAALSQQEGTLKDLEDELAVREHALQQRESRARSLEPAEQISAILEGLEGEELEAAMQPILGICMQGMRQMKKPQSLKRFDSATGQVGQGQGQGQEPETPVRKSGGSAEKHPLSPTSHVLGGSASKIPRMRPLFGSTSPTRSIMGLIRQPTLARPPIPSFQIPESPFKQLDSPQTPLPTSFGGLRLESPGMALPDYSQATSQSASLSQMDWRVLPPPIPSTRRLEDAQIVSELGSPTKSTRGLPPPAPHSGPPGPTDSARQRHQHPWEQINRLTDRRMRDDGEYEYFAERYDGEMSRWESRARLLQLDYAQMVEDFDQGQDRLRRQGPETEEPELDY